jgi:hypothetical protein
VVKININSELREKIMIKKIGRQTKN